MRTGKPLVLTRRAIVFFVPLAFLLLPHGPRGQETPPAEGTPTKKAVAAAPASLRAGFASIDITPPLGTPSAGYGARFGGGMQGVHDPLEAGTLILAAGAKILVLAGVDNLGFDSGMVEEIRAGARRVAGLEEAEVHVGSSHTHSGGGAHIAYPAATILFGIYNPERRRSYIDGTVRSIRDAAGRLRPARLGIGYREVEGLNRYRGKWPRKVPTNPWLTLIKVTGPADEPLAALFVYAAHPTVLGGEYWLFSADFVGYARRAVAARVGGASAGGFGCVYFNGAQGDVSPRAPKEAPAEAGKGDGPAAGQQGEEAGPFAGCRRMGERLGDEVAALWKETATRAEISIATERFPFTRPMRPSSNGYTIATGDHSSELNAIRIDGEHVLVTIPGELSAIYDSRIRDWARWLGFRHATILGLTDDAMGYIITPEAFRHRTYESTVSFGGIDMGPFIEEKAIELLHKLEPEEAAGAAGGR